MQLIYRILWDNDLYSANTVLGKFIQTKLQDENVIERDKERETEKVRDFSNSEAVQFQN